MATVKDLLHSEADGSLSFGDHELGSKQKLEDFKHDNRTYRVKTFYEITRLECDDELVYESVPGTSVNNLVRTENGMKFKVEGKEDAQITLGLEPDCEYDIIVAGDDAGKMKTNLGGKLSISVELSGSGQVDVEVKKA